MSQAPILLSLTWQLIAGVGVIVSLVMAFRRLPIRALIAEPKLQHLFFGAVVLMVLVWSFRAGLSEGLSIYFLGITTLTLLFGWDLAVIAGCIAHTVLTLIGVDSWSMLTANLLALVIIPAATSIALLRWVEKQFPPNFFVYLFLVAFIGGGVAAAAGGLSLAVILGIDGVHSWTTIYQEYIQYLPLIMFPEGLLNGIIMTAMMVFHPDWIRTFDATRYIDEQ